MRMLDADAEGADWREVARIVLHIDSDHEPDRARQAFGSHLAGAKWMTKDGYRHLLRRGGLARLLGSPATLPVRCGFAVKFLGLLGHQRLIRDVRDVSATHPIAPILPQRGSAL